jgi:hypothetical protein
VVINLRASFWGDQGRIALVGSGRWAGRYALVYPDSRPGWWTVVVSPSEGDAAPNDLYVEGNDEVRRLLDELDVQWLEQDEAERAIESTHFGWRPLQPHQSWLD